MDADTEKMLRLRLELQDCRISHLALYLCAIGMTDKSVLSIAVNPFSGISPGKLEQTLQLSHIGIDSVRTAIVLIKIFVVFRNGVVYLCQVGLNLRKLTFQCSLVVADGVILCTERGNLVVIVGHLGLVHLGDQRTHLFVHGANLIFKALNLVLTAFLFLLQLVGPIRAHLCLVQSEILRFGVFQMISLISILFPIERPLRKSGAIITLGQENDRIAAFHFVLIRDGVILASVVTQLICDTL